MIDHASAFITSTVSSSLTMLSGLGHTQATPDYVFDSGEIDLTEDEILDQDRGEEGEVDDSLEPLRLANVIAVRKADENRPVGQKASLRRQWEILPLRTTRAHWSRNGPNSP